MSVLKKALHSALSVLVSVSMALTLTPALAFADPDGESQGDSQITESVQLNTGIPEKASDVTSSNVLEYVTAKSSYGSDAGSNDNTRYLEETTWTDDDGVEHAAVKGSTEVKAIVYDADFSFTNITEFDNFKTATDAATSIKNGITAIFGLPLDSFNITWKLVEVEQDQAGQYKPVAGQTPKFEESQKYDVSGADGALVPPVITTGEGKEVMEFTCTNAEASYFENGKLYAYVIELRQNEKVATAKTIISVNSDYTNRVAVGHLDELTGATNNSYSVKGDLLGSISLGSANFVELVYSLANNTSPTYQLIQKKAAEYSDSIDEATTYMLDNYTSSGDDAKNPYEKELEVRVPINMDAYDTVPTSVNVYRCADVNSGTVAVYQNCAIVDAKDSDGNILKDSEGNTIKVAIVKVSGTGTSPLLGTFAIGVPADEQYIATATATAGGSITPQGLSQYDLIKPQSWTMGADIPGYAFTGVDVSIGGNKVNIPDSAITSLTDTSATLTIDYTVQSWKDQGLEEGANVVIVANFKKVTPASSEYDVKVSLESSDGATGSVTIDPAMGTEPSQQTIAMGDSATFKMPSTVGMLFTFAADSGSILEKLEMRNVGDSDDDWKQLPAMEGASTYMLSALFANSEFKVTYKKGIPDPDAKTVNVTAQIAEQPDDKQAYLIDTQDPHDSVTTTTYTVTYGNAQNIVAYHPDTYVLTSAELVTVGGTSVNVLSNVEKGETFDTIKLFNLTKNATLSLKYGAGITTLSITGDLTKGTVNPSTDQTLAEGDEVRVSIRPHNDYQIGDVTLDGSSITQLLNMQDDASGSIGTITIVRSETLGAGMPTKAQNGDSIIYVNGKTSTLFVRFDSNKPPAQGYYSVFTSVNEATKHGTITPDQSVAVRSDGSVDDVTVSFFPDEHYRVKSVKRTIDGVDSDITNAVQSGRTLTIPGSSITSDVYVEVTFEPGEPAPPLPDRYTIKAIADGGGMISPDGDIPVYKGDNQKFNFIPATGKKVDKVLVGTNEADASARDVSDSSYTFQNIESDGYIRVSFVDADEPVGTMHQISVQQPTVGGSVNPAGNTDIANGGNFVLVIMPEQGYVIDKILVADKNGSPIDMSSKAQDQIVDGVYACSTFTLEGVQSDKSIEVVFREDPDGKPANPTLMIKLDGLNCTVDNGAMLSPEFDGLMFPKPADGANHSGIDANFTISILPGFEFDGIEGSSEGNALTDSDYNIVNVGDSTMILTINKNKVTDSLKLHVKVKQKPAPTESVKTRTVTLQVNGDGKISPSGDKNRLTVEAGSSPQFSFIPDDGNKLEEVVVDGVNVTSDVLNSGYTYVIQDIKENVHVKATFVPGMPDPALPAKYTIDVNAPESGGVVSPSGAVEVFDNAGFTITMVPDAGKSAEVRVGGTVLTANGSPVALSGGGTAQLTGNTVVVAGVTGDSAIDIEFKDIEVNKYHQVSLGVEAVSGEKHGTISPSGNITVVHNASPSVTFLPDSDYTVDQVKVSRKSDGSVIRTYEYADVASGTPGANDGILALTMDPVTEDMSVIVTYKTAGPDEISGADLKPTNKVNISVDGYGGMVSPTSLEVADGRNASVSLIALDGYEVDSVTIDGTPIAQVAGASVTAEGTLTFTPAHKGDGSATNVSVSFKKSGETEFSRYYQVAVNVETELSAQKAEELGYGNGTKIPADLGGSVYPEGMNTVSANGDFSITYIPNSGFKVKSVIVRNVATGAVETLDGEEVMSGGTKALFGISADHQVFVTFTTLGPNEITQAVLAHDIVVTHSANGTVSPSGTMKVADRGEATFTFVPANDFQLSYIKVDGNTVYASQITNMQYKFVSVTSGHTLHAVFVSDKEAQAEYHTVHVSTSGSGGSITPSGEVVVTSGEDLALQVTPYYGYKTDKVMVFGEELNLAAGSGTIADVDWVWTNGTLTLKKLDRDVQQVSALFVKDESVVTPEYTYLQTTVAGESLSSSEAVAGLGGATFLGRGTNRISLEQIPAGQTYDVSIIPDEGWTVTHIEKRMSDGTTTPVAASQIEQIGGTAITAGTGYITLSSNEINNGIELYVIFRELAPNETVIPPKFFEITAKAEGGGTIAPAGIVEVASGSSPTFNMVPLANFELQGITIGSSGPVSIESGTRAYKFGAISQNDTITAKFGYVEPERAETHKITVTGSTGGVVSPSEIEVPDGESVMLYFFPDPNKIVGSIQIGDGEVREFTGTSYQIPASELVDDLEVKVQFRDLRPGESTPVLNPLNIKATVAYNEGGKISPTEAIVPEGSSQRFYITPDANWVLDYVMVNGERQMLSGATTSYDFTPVVRENGQDNTFEAFFRKASEVHGPQTVKVEVKPSVTVQANTTVTVDGEEIGLTNCTVSPTQRIVNWGDPASFYILPDTGWKIDHVYANGKDVKFSLADDIIYKQGDEYIIYQKDESGEYKTVTGAGGIMPNDSKARTLQRSGTFSLASYVPESGLGGFFGGWLRAAAYENAEVYGNVYQFTIDSVQGDTNVEVHLSPIDTNEPFKWVNAKTPMLNVKYSGSGTVSPVGPQLFPSGENVTIDIAAGAFYWLESVTITTEDSSGNTVSKDVTSQVKNDKLSFTMPEKDTDVEIMFQKVGDPGAPVYLTVADVIKTTDGKEYPVAKFGETMTGPHATIGLFDTSEEGGEDVLYAVDSEGYLVYANDYGSNKAGDKVPFNRNSEYSLFVSISENGPNGRPYIIESAKVDGVEIPVNAGDGYINWNANTQGKLEVTMREANENETVNNKGGYNIEVEAVAGSGEATSGTNRPHGSTFPVAFNPEGASKDTDPNSEHWMVGKVIDKYDFNKDTGEYESSRTVQTSEYKDGIYNVYVDGPHKIEVHFIRATWVEVNWNDSEGYIMPNAAPGDSYLVKPMSGQDTNSLTEGVDPTDNPDTNFIVGSYLLNKDTEDEYAYDLYSVQVNGEDVSGFATQSEAARDELGNITSVDYFDPSYGDKRGFEDYALDMTYDEAVEARLVDPQNAGGNITNAAYAALDQFGTKPKEEANFYTAYDYLLDGQELPNMSTFATRSMARAATSPNLSTVNFEFTGQRRFKEQTYTIEASVRPGADGKPHGTISTTQQPVVKGGSVTFAFVPDTGYRVKSIYINGNAQNYASNSYTWSNITANGTFQVEFTSATDGSAGGGAGGTITRLLRTLTGLAQTGDLNGPIMAALVTIAIVGVGISVMSYRSRKRARRKSSKA